MASEIQPGQWINVKVTAEPRSAASLKTMHRVLQKDESVRAEHRRRRRARPPKWHIRGGRRWFDRPARLSAVETKPGSAYKLFASVDVLRDLESLRRYVEITPAS
jgi:hypothetical protein